ncbi:virion structural protein [Arthrobacter phage Reedo]|uniref:Minor tail protein n=1 Tax=Arthrobacter phage Reedo TaxID=2910755 RepID=A0AA49BN51_9CAUD|nr:virion structural protein [Arthrobacter phage Reedo]UJQ86810.1 minor tail protein [Arthrobacter phage Reedo]
MTANRGLFIRNNGTVGTTPIEGRLALAGLVFENSPGNPRSGLLDQKATTVVSGTANMSYDVAPITPVISRAAGEGVYIFTLTGTSNVPTTAAPATGSRYDLIYVKQNDLDKGDADNNAVVSVLQGADAASPTKPYASLPAGAYVLAEALVQSGATATNSASVTITQVWKYTVLRGAPLPIRNKAERDEITGARGMEITRLDCDDWKQEHDGTGWKFVGWRRSEVAPQWFLSAGSNSRQVALINETKPYARRVNVYGRLTIYCPTISSGKEEINVAVSAVTSQVTSAQARSRLTWGPGTANSDTNQTSAGYARNVSVGAGGDVMARLWIEVISGAVSLIPSGGTYSELSYEYIPEND